MDKLPCPFCGGEAAMKEWDGFGRYVRCSVCKACGAVKPTDEEAIAAWNRRAQPANEPRECPAMERVEGGIPYCSDKQTACNGCKNAQPENEPLTLDELREMDGEPVWIESTAEDKPSGYGIVGHTRNHEKLILVPTLETCFYEHDYGKTWLAYRRKPKEEHHEAD